MKVRGFRSFYESFGGDIHLCRQASTTSGDGSVEEEVEDDILVDPPPYTKERRSTILGAAVTEDAMAKYPIVVHPKDQETLASLKELLSDNLLFRHLDAQENKELCDAMRPMEFEAGAVIIRQHDDGDNFYVMEEGAVEVFVDGLLVTVIEKGGTFGELALMYDAPRAATVTAKGRVKVFALDRISYKRILMVSTMEKRKMYDKFLSKVRILESLHQWERDTVADALETFECEEGERVVEQGQDGTYFFIIQDGEAVVVQRPSESESESSEKEVNRLRRGDYFGEVALLMKRPRAASVVAATPLRGICLDRDRFERLMGPVEDILRRNIDNYRSYVNLNE